MFRCLAKKCFVEIDDLFRLMIEEIQLGARNSKLAEHLEELLTRFRRPQLVGMLPEPYGYALLSRVHSITSRRSSVVHFRQMPSMM